MNRSGEPIDQRTTSTNGNNKKKRTTPAASTGTPACRRGSFFVSNFHETQIAS
jgi:hypothetical protein